MESAPASHSVEGSLPDRLTIKALPVPDEALAKGFDGNPVPCNVYRTSKTMLSRDQPVGWRDLSNAIIRDQTCDVKAVLQARITRFGERIWSPIRLHFVPVPVTAKAATLRWEVDSASLAVSFLILERSCCVTG